MRRSIFTPALGHTLSLGLSVTASCDMRSCIWSAVQTCLPPFYIYSQAPVFQKPERDNILKALLSQTLVGPLVKR